MIFEDFKRFEDIETEMLDNYVNFEIKRKKRVIKNPRTAMMVNPLKLKHLNNIDNLKADIVILNLEDGVEESKKKRALKLIKVFLSHLKSSTSMVVVRVNPLELGGKEEILELNDINPDAIRVSKIENKDEVGASLSLIKPHIDIHLSLETKEALENLKTLRFSSRVTTLYVGMLDLLNSFELSQAIMTPDNPVINYLLSKILIEAKMVNFVVVGLTFQDYHNTEAFRKWAMRLKEIGYCGISCIGPKQVDIAHEIFNVSKEEIKRAKSIKESFERHKKNGISGFMHSEYGFIDDPIYKDALLILDSDIN